MEQGQNLRLYQSDLASFSFGAEQPATPNAWWVQRYPEQFETHGSPFLELPSNQIICVTQNIDFFASVLGGRRCFKHSPIYFAPEMAWYFKDSDGVYQSTTGDKLATLYRALMMKCAQDMPANVNKLNLVHQFRSDQVAKAIVNRAKSVLEADSSFFSLSSPYQRVKGPELVERIAKTFVDELLTREPGQILKLGEAYAVFQDLLKQRAIPGIKRSDFKAVVVPLMRDQFNVALRNDLGMDGGGVRGWKDVMLRQTVPV